MLVQLGKWFSMRPEDEVLLGLCGAGSKRITSSSAWAEHIVSGIKLGVIGKCPNSCTTTPAPANYYYNSYVSSIINVSVEGTLAPYFLGQEENP